MKLPKAEQNLGEWQAAIECLILVAEKNGPTMMARIGMMKALNRHVVREFNPDRKDSNWGKRKETNDRGGQAAPPKAGKRFHGLLRVSRGSGNTSSHRVDRQDVLPMAT